MTAPETDPPAVDPSPPPAPAGPAAGSPLRRMPLARRWRVSWGVGAVVVVLVYVIVALAYSADSRTVEAEYNSVRVDSADLVVDLTPLSVDAASQRMTLQVELEVNDTALLNDKNVLVRDLDIEVLPAGGAALTFSAGRLPDSRTVTVPLSGDIENWPFDGYETDIIVDAQAPATAAAQADFPVVGVKVGGVVQGWSGQAGAVAADVLSPAVTADGVHLHFGRALAIKLFAGVLILVMVLMPILLLSVAVPLYREERLFEAGFLGYAAAMLFATVPLRNFFPGNPPAGSWVDVLVVLWVLVALIIGIGVTVLAFLRHPRGR